ncbi:MAG TPA: ECF-type sigma factor [Silvibacterium sp.]|nr:ECF-type sigma factor [Silvibacterium sp.]
MSDPIAPATLAPGKFGDVTSLLIDWGNGDSRALDQLAPIIYDDLLRIAKARLNREYRQSTLEPAALVHESYLRLADQTKLQCENRAHFYAVAANCMRRVLIDHAKRRNAQKRGGGIKITLKTNMDFATEREPDSLLLDEALRKLTEIDQRKGRVIELKFFGGLTTEEIALVLEISVATVGRELRLGQAWLRREMSRSSS